MCERVCVGLLRLCVAVNALALVCKRIGTYV